MWHHYCLQIIPATFLVFIILLVPSQWTYISSTFPFLFLVYWPLVISSLIGASVCAPHCFHSSLCSTLQHGPALHVSWDVHISSDSPWTPVKQLQSGFPRSGHTLLHSSHRLSAAGVPKKSFVEKEAEDLPFHLILCPSLGPGSWYGLPYFMTLPGTGLLGRPFLILTLGLSSCQQSHGLIPGSDLHLWLDCFLPWKLTWISPAFLYFQIFTVEQRVRNHLLNSVFL